MPDAAPTVEEPQGLLDKLGAALPIALTAIATAFAGMSTSELQQAMFWRSAAAQDQAKATSQWTLAGFKRDRSLICQTTAATIRAQAGYPVLSTDLERSLPDSAIPFPAYYEGLDWLDGKGPPPAKLPEITDPSIQTLTAAAVAREPEADILYKARTVSLAELNQAIDNAEKAVEQIDKEWDPIVKSGSKHAERAGQFAGSHKEGDKTGNGSRTRASAMQAAFFELEQRRYRIEASLNQGVSLLYEARVKVSTATSDRHRMRSQNFFYAMLAAQVGATVASLALARRRKSLLWLLAGLAGLVAIAMGAYVYVGM